MLQASLRHTTGENLLLGSLNGQSRVISLQPWKAPDSLAVEDYLEPVCRESTNETIAAIVTSSQAWTMTSGRARSVASKVAFSVPSVRVLREFVGVKPPLGDI